MVAEGNAAANSPLKGSIAIGTDEYIIGAPGVSSSSTVIRARICAFPRTIGPATVTGELAPTSGIVITIGGTPALANSIAASVVRPRTIGDEVHTTAERTGRLRSSSTPPATACAIFTAYTASSRM